MDFPLDVDLGGGDVNGIFIQGGLIVSIPNEI